LWSRRLLLLPPVGLFCQWVCCFPLVGPFLLPVDLLSLASGPFHIAVGCRLPVASFQLPAACFTSTGGSIYLTGRRHLSHWSDICFLLLPVASAGEPDGSISAAKLSAMSCPQDTSSKADKAHQKPNMGACKKATSAHKRGQNSKCAPDKGQTGPQERPKYVPAKKGEPAHKKGQNMSQQKRANQPTRKAKVCARRKGQTAPQERPKYVPEEKGKPAHKKGQSRRQSKHQSGPQERLMLQMRAREKRLFRDPQGHCQDSKPNQDR
ncbi:hypothetical protein PHYBLDRAFT_69654, partial [Phycomyces blakesleeanus NRRL 1555(-)]